MNNKNSYFKYMFTGVDTKIVTMSSFSFIFIGLFIEGGWICCSLGALVLAVWYSLGFYSWKKYVG